MSDKLKEAIKESGSISRQAMTWLRDKKLPADPLCYHVAYQLFHLPEPDLKQRVEQLRGKPEEVFQSVHQIYHDFIHSKLENNLKQFSRKIDSIANQTIDSVADTKGHLESFSVTLQQIQPLLEKNSGDAHINVISLLINETQNTHEYANILEQKLHRAVEELRELQSDHMEFRDRANRDPLTQILNRSGLEDAYDNIAVLEDSYPMAVLIADIDHFKAFNDNHGHLIGDSVLKAVATTLRTNLKRRDILARFGGEEFLMLLPNTSKRDGQLVAENLRGKIETLAIRKKNNNENVGTISLSFGVSELTQNDSLNEAIEKADRALYCAKQDGRNCVRAE